MIGNNLTPTETVMKVIADNIKEEGIETIKQEVKEEAEEAEVREVQEVEEEEATQIISTEKIMIMKDFTQLKIP